MTTEVYILLLWLALAGMAFWVFQLYKKQAAPLPDSLSKNKETDSTELYEAEATLINTLKDAILFLDADQKVLHSNKVAKKLFLDLPLQEAPIDSIIESSQVLKLISQAYEQSKEVREVVTLTQAESLKRERENRGDNAWHIDISPMPSGSYFGSFRLIIQDRTQEFQTEQVRKDFVANASHELRTPLCVINGYLENVLEDEFIQSEPETTHRFLTISKRNVDRVLRIVDAMLVLSKIDQAKQVQLNPTEFDLNECVKDVIFQLEALLKEKDVTVNFSFSEEHLPVYGDAFYWHQVISNLVENSIKYNPDTDLIINIQTLKQEECFTLNITDNGVGIPLEDQTHVFRRFYRVDKSHGGKQKGTGLGLSIVKRSIEAHQGSISLASTPNKETTFTISAPLCPKI